jgi:hypothetical protein
MKHMGPAIGFDGNGSMDQQAYQHYDAICQHSNLNNREKN